MSSPGCLQWSMSVRGSWSRLEVETHHQTLKEHFDNFVLKSFPLDCQMYLSFYRHPRSSLTTQWVFYLLPVNKLCNFEPNSKDPLIKMTQSGIKARNQGRRGSEIKDISLSVQTASGLIEQRKTYFVDFYQASSILFQANPVIQSSKSVARSFRENAPKLRRAGSTLKWSIFMGQPSRTLSTSMQFSK